MTGSIIIVASGFSQDNVRLQPWRYLYEIARRLGALKPVVVITEGGGDADEETWPEGLRIVRTRHLSVRRQKTLGDLIRTYKPAQLWWSVTPRSIAYWRLLADFACPRYALITCPLYSYRDLARASLSGVPFQELRALWQQRLVPRPLFARLLRGHVFKKVFVQSGANAGVLAEAGVQPDRLSVLPVGVDAADRAPVPDEVLAEERSRLGTPAGTVTLLYFGAIRRIRGFHALLGAFSRVVADAAQVRLVVLARGAEDAQLAEVKRELERYGLSGKVFMIGGWLSREQVWAHIELCDLVVLPFVIVPSDVPIAVLEAMARGKPVIGSPVDGIPDLLSGRGMVVDPLSTGAFARSILALVNDRETREKLGRSALGFMQGYPDWDHVGDRLISEVGLI